MPLILFGASMKIKVKRLFRYMATPTDTKDIVVGVYSVPEDISDELAQKILRFGKAEVLQEKKAPENKVVATPENKTRVAAPTGNRRSTRAKPDK